MSQNPEDEEYKRKEKEFSEAVEKGDSEKAKLYLDAGLSSDSRLINSEFGKCFQDPKRPSYPRPSNYPMTKLLLEYGANPNSKKGWILIRAVKYMSSPIVKLLVDYGADVSVENYAPLYLALNSMNYETAKILLEKIDIGQLDPKIVMVSIRDVIGDCAAGDVFLLEDQKKTARDAVFLLEDQKKTARDAVPVVALLVKMGADVRSWGGWLLKRAVDSDMYPIQKLLLNAI